MAELDIAERRLPQDGRIELNVGGNPVDLRVSVLPTMFGEAVVREAVDTPELQDEALRAFILVMQRNSRGKI